MIADSQDLQIDATFLNYGQWFKCLGGFWKSPANVFVKHVLGIYTLGPSLFSDFHTREVDTSTPLPTLFQALAWSQTQEVELAELEDVIEYLKRSKYLKVPDEWLSCLQ